MSSEKNPEVVGCDASIMKDVWEIRERDLLQKQQQETERLSKSALSSINQDWTNRVAARQGGYKRAERKAKVSEAPGDDSSKTKRFSVRVSAPAPSRPGPQRPAPGKGQKGQDSGVGKAHRLKSLTTSQPSPMVWGKSWKFSKELPQSEESITPSNWGECWKFATRQPFTEAGKPWPNGPCQINHAALQLWEKPVLRVPEEEPSSTLCSHEWSESWRNANKGNKDNSSETGTPKYGLFTSLVESHRHNSDLYCSEWSNGWKSTKPSDNEDIAGSVAKAAPENRDNGQSSEWAGAWRLSNHHGITKTPEVRQVHSPEWFKSWSVAFPVQNSSEGSAIEGKADQHTSKEIVFADKRKSHRSFSDLEEEFKAFSEWAKSWQVIKNDNKPSPEIEKTLKTQPPKMEQAVRVQERPELCSSDAASKFSQLRQSVLFPARREVTHSVMLRLKDLEKASACPEWKDSWKMLKHQLRTTQRQRRVQPKPFDDQRAGEWKDSWKYTAPSLGNQTPEMWQKGWSATPQMRVNRAYNHFAPVELPKNGPAGERTWNESWRMSRRPLDANQRGSNTNPVSPPVWLPQRQRSPGDWQEAWRVSETQHRHDKPSYAQWVEAWKCSLFQSGNYQCNRRLMGTQWVSLALEIAAKRDVVSLQRAEKNVAQERCVDNVWAGSWKVGSMLKKGSADGKSNVQGGSSEYGSKWGMSFRMANPMPKTEEPWMKSSPNPCFYQVLWPNQRLSRGHDIKADFTNNIRVTKLWCGSQQFLQSFSPELCGQKAPGRATDPREILSKKTSFKKQMYVSLDRREKQQDQKWAGCHLLGKTQPKPKRGGAVKKVKVQEDSNEAQFEEAWGESWRVLLRPEALKNRPRSLRGWDEAWKMFLPPYQMLGGAKTRKV
ncbi:unnamed protein product [Knipowitschia caucasica]|uniref:Uncharacterized protein n=1 Tax=Knipowitschia caucasica TaxID=637954 RepID=A0AAV2IU22_KNICA